MRRKVTSLFGPALLLSAAGLSAAILTPAYDPTAARIYSGPQADGAALSNAIANMPNGTALVIPSGTYFFSQTNRFVSGANSNYCNILINQKTNIVIKGFAGPLLSLTQQCGTLMLVLNSSGVTIDGIAFQSATSNGLLRNITYTDASVFGNLEVCASDVLVRECDFRGGQDHGILVTDPAAAAWITFDTNRTIVDSCTISNYGSWLPPQGRYDGAGIVCGPSWIVRDNFITACAAGIEPYSSGGAAGDYCVIRNNVVRNCLVSAIGGRQLRRMSIEGNQIWNDTAWTREGSNTLPLFAAIDLTDIDHLTLRQNRVDNWWLGIKVYSSGLCVSNVVIAENSISRGVQIVPTGEEGPGLAVAGGTKGIQNIQILDNAIWDARTSAIEISALTNGTVRGNTIWNANRSASAGHGASAISLFWPGVSGVWTNSSQVTIEGNYFADGVGNAPTAIYLDPYMLTNGFIGNNRYGPGITVPVRDQGPLAAVNYSWASTNVSLSVGALVANMTTNILVPLYCATTNDFAFVTLPHSFLNSNLCLQVNAYATNAGVWIRISNVTNAASLAFTAPFKVAVKQW